MKYFYSDYIGKSKKYAQQYGLKMNPKYNGWNDECDAFRHAFMQALLSIKIGETAARRIGTAYEIYGDITDHQKRSERNMDQWNNAVGREIGREVMEKIREGNLSPKEIEDFVAEKVIHRLRKGDLITNPYTDTRIFNEKTFTDKIFDLKNRVFHQNEIKMSELDNPITRDVFLDQFLEKEGLPTKEILDRKTQTGELVYVEDYIRSDGTKVSGYFRSCPRRQA